MFGARLRESKSATNMPARVARAVQQQRSNVRGHCRTAREAEQHAHDPIFATARAARLASVQ